jgi:ABC-type Fe3+/spermidine/putrescine transport system ATPase subunit
MRFEVRRLHDEYRYTTVYVTHDQSEAMTTADVIAVMNAGRIEQVGPPLEVYRRPGSSFVAGFIGRTNLLQGEASGDDAIAVAGRPFDVAGDADLTGDVTISVRPEAAQLIAGDVPDRNALPGTVVFVRDLGELFECYVDCGLEDHVIVAGSPRDWVPVAQGTKVAVRFPAEECVVVEEGSGGSRSERVQRERSPQEQGG